MPEEEKLPEDYTHCGEHMIAVEYGYGDPYRYDGVSEWFCNGCKIRFGRWTGKVLKDGEQEPPYGEERNVTNETKHYNL